MNFLHYLLLDDEQPTTIEEATVGSIDEFSEKETIDADTVKGIYIQSYIPNVLIYVIVNFL